MLTVRPTHTGYDAFNIYHKRIFSEENCALLFAFIEADTTKLYSLLTRYTESRIDEEAMQPIGTRKPKKLCADIKKEMESIHPCLSSNHYAVLFMMLAEHLNSLWHEAQPESVPDMDTYAALLRHLFQSLLEIYAEPLPPAIVPTSKEFCQKYYAQLTSLYTEKPVELFGLKYVESVRAEAERYLFWVLDQSSIRFRDLDRDTRLRLYSQVFRKSAIGSDLRFISHFYWQEPEEYNYYEQTMEARLLCDIQENISVAESRDCRAREDAAKRHRQKMISYLAQWHDDAQELTDELKTFVDDEIHSAKESTVPTLFEEYRVDNFYQLIQLQLWLLSKSEPSIKRCRHCGRLFVTEKLSFEYCHRIADGETEPCDVIGPKKAYAKLLDTDSVLKTYNRIYKTKYARVKRGTMSEEDFSKWKAEARYMLDRCRNGELSEADFNDWIRADVRVWGSATPAEEKPAPKKLGEE